MTDQILPKKNSVFSRSGALVVSIFIVIAAAGVFYYYYSKQPGNSLSTNDTDEEVLAEEVELAEWDRYDIDLEENALTYTNKAGDIQLTPAPFTLTDYYAQSTLHGMLFWKIGEEKIATTKEGEEFSYEAPVQPDFRWYDYTAKLFSALPVQSFLAGDESFEHVYDIHASSSENKLLIEVGKYETGSDAFQPSELDSQPTSVRGVLFDAAAGTVTESDILAIALAALSKSTSNAVGVNWDSKLSAVTSVPYNNDCIFDSLITFVDVSKKTANSVGGKKSLTFADEECNPMNGASPDGKWFALFGKSAAGQLDIYLFDAAHGITPVADKKNISVGTEDFPSGIDVWDTTKEMPVITFNTGDTIDFN